MIGHISARQTLCGAINPKQALCGVLTQKSCLTGRLTKSQKLQGHLHSRGCLCATLNPYKMSMPENYGLITWNGITLTVS